MQNKLGQLIAVVTRPAGQADELTRLVVQAGGRVVAFPTLEISRITDTSSLQQQVTQVADGDWVIFVSANAVRSGMALVSQTGVSLEQVKVISIGRSTTSELAKLGIEADLSSPPPASSESLLATPDLRDVEGQRIYIFKGKGGRQLLGQTLVERGAIVRYLECYKRRLPQMDPDVLQPTARIGVYNVVITTSVEGLGNFINVVSGSEYQHLLQSDLVVIGERQKRAAEGLGWKGNVVAVADAANELILAKLEELANHRAESP